MQLARVCGQVISTKKAEKLMGFKILVCQPIDMVTFEEKGAPFVSIDSVGAGEGELVMCVAGSSSRQTALTDARPVDNCIVAIIDSVDILGERCFDKADPDVKPAAAKAKENKPEPVKADEKPAEVKQEKAVEAKPDEAKAEEKPQKELVLGSGEKKPRAKKKPKAEKPEQPKAEEQPEQLTLEEAATAEAEPVKEAEEDATALEAKRIVEDIMKKLDAKED